MRPGNEDALALDRAFFEANPDRSHRVRYALTSELLDAVGVQVWRDNLGDLSATIRMRVEVSRQLG